MKINYISALALLGALAPGMVMAATATGEATASAKVITPVTVTESQPLNFGTMTNESGMVSVDTDGSRSSDGDNLVNDTSNPPSAGVVYVSGAAGQYLSVEVPDGVTITSTGGDSLTVSLSSTATQGMSTDGHLEIRIGGGVQPAASSEGDYTGTYTITVNY